MSRPLNWAKLTAEFGVIVVGVLIALAADRWRESAGDAELRAQYLDDLITEIRVDNEAYGRMASTSYIDKASDRVLQALLTDPHPDEVVSLFYAIEALQWYNPPVVNGQTYNDLISTGNLVLLAPELRKVVAQYYDRVNFYEQRESIFTDILVDGYRHAPSRILGPRLHPELFSRIQERRKRKLDDLPVDWQIDLVEIDSVLDRLRNIPELESWIAERLYIDRQHREIYGDRMARWSSAFLDILVGVRDGTIEGDQIAFDTAVLQR
jgi:hypothetical protein